MAFQVGLDIEEIKRFRDKPFAENTHFYKRVFTEQEIEYCLAKHDPYVHFTGKFAAKEAVYKAMNEVIDITLTQIEIGNNENGKPFVHLLSQQGELKYSLQISISHAKEYAVAVAMYQQ